MFRENAHCGAMLILRLPAPMPRNMPRAYSRKLGGELSRLLAYGEVRGYFGHWVERQKTNCEK